MKCEKRELSQKKKNILLKHFWVLAKIPFEMLFWCWMQMRKQQTRKQYEFKIIFISY